MSTDPAIDDTDLPCPDVLAAATMALMSQWAVTPARPHTSERSPDLRGLMARKIVSNLFFLMQHPQARPAFRQVMAQAHARWQAVVDAGEAATATAPAPALAEPRASTAVPDTHAGTCTAEAMSRPTLH